ncbi:Protein of unknown function [Gryllus bimaculatus]|nr:Protein of unknown function [Gryllus bimaculatus]
MRFQALLVCVLLLLLVLAGVSIWYKFNSGPDALTKFKEMVDDYQHSDKYAYKIAVIQETIESEIYNVILDCLFYFDIIYFISILCNIF